MAGINVVRRWVMSQMTKKADDGIMITLPEKNKVDLNVSITMDRLLRNGIDPDQITNPQQVDNAINMINSRMVSRTIPADSDEGREITEKIFGKQKAPVFDLEGNRIPEGSGIMGGKAIKDLMETGQVSKGARGMKKSKKVQDREMFQAANKRLTSDVDSIIKNIKSMEPINAMKEANSVIGRKGKYKNLTQEQSKKILQDTEDHIFERDIPEEDFATGGRAGFKGGGSDASTTSYSKSYDKQHGTNTASRANKSVDRRQAAGQRDADNTNRRMEANRQAGLSEIFPPKETVIDKIKNSRFNNPLTRTLGRTALYAYNPSLGIIDARKAMDLKRVYDLAQSEINNPIFNEEEVTSGGIGGMTSNLITDQQKSIIDKQGNIGKLTGAFDPNQTFNAAKKFDDKGGFFSDAEPMTREEFDNYVKEKGFATGGRANFVGGGMGRRGFLKLLGLTGAGIAGAKTGLMSLAKKSEPVVEAVKETAQGVPPYFFKLVEKIKKFGDDVTGKSATQEREIVTEYKDFRLTEDIATGEKTIQRQKIKLDDAADYYGKPLTEETYMSYKPGRGQADEMTGPIPDEYEEGTALLRNDKEFAGDIVDESFKISDDVIEEAMSEAPSIKIKKASGGIARMLGE